MASVRPKSNSGKRIADWLALLLCALLLIAVGGSAFLLADKYDINEAWVFGAWAAVFFFIIVGWGYRSKFRNTTFVSFFLAWMLVHVLIYLLVLGYLGFLYYVPIVVLELWIGYTIAIWQFGPPAFDRRVARGPQTSRSLRCVGGPPESRHTRR
jgi:hypothetical protein